MYKKQLDVKIYSKENLIFDTLSNMSSDSEISYSFELIDSLDSSDVKADICILDLPFEDLKASTLSKFKSNYCMLVICLDLGKLELIPDDVLDDIDSIWYRPYTADYLVFNFKIVVRELETLHTCLFEQSCLDALFDTSKDLLWVKDIFGTYKKVNQVFCDCFEKNHYEIEGNDDYYLMDFNPDIVPEYQLSFLQTDNIVLQNENAQYFDEEMILKDGKHLYKTLKCPMKNEFHEIIGTIGISHDITNIDNINNEFDSLIEALPFPLLIIDLNGYPIKVNNLYLDLFGFKRENISRHSMDNFAIFNKVDLKWTIEETGESTYLHFGHKKYKIIKDHYKNSFNENVGYVYFLLDVSMEDTYVKLLEQASNTDYLTKVNNRKRLNSYLEEIKESKRLSLLSFELQNLKNLNDIYGRTEGDMALIHFANILRDIVPNEKIFRLGGNKFLIVFSEDITTDQLEEYSDLIKEKVHTSYAKLYNKSNVSLKIGISTELTSSAAFAKLFKKADSLFYNKK